MVTDSVHYAIWHYIGVFRVYLKKFHGYLVYIIIDYLGNLYLSIPCIIISYNFFIDYLIYSYSEYLPRVPCYLIPLYSDSYSEEDTCSQGKMTHTLTGVVHLHRLDCAGCKLNIAQCTL